MATYLTVAGEPPLPTELAIFDWFETIHEYIRQTCDFHRTGPIYYIDNARADDSGNGTSPATAKKTIAAAQTLHDALTSQQESDGATFLFKCGERWREDEGMDITKDNVRIGNYGAATSGKPRITNFTILINAANANWVNANAGTDAKNRWSINLDQVDANPGAWTSIGWIRHVQDPWNPFRAVTSTTECEDTPRSFFFDTAGDGGSGTLHLNPGYLWEPPFSGTQLDALKHVPENFDWEANGDPENPISTNPLDATYLAQVMDRGFEVTGTNCLLEGCQTEGWGCAARYWSSASGLTVASNGTTLVRDWEDYYTGRHCASLEVEAPLEGGQCLFERVFVGFPSQTVSSATLLNSYGEADFEHYVLDCKARFGPLPDTYALAVNGKVVAFAHGECLPYGAFFAHAGSGNTLSIYHSNRCEIEDNRGKYPFATACYFNYGMTAANFPGSVSDPTGWRGYVFNYKTHESECSRTTNWPETTGVSISLPTKCWFVNSNIHLWKKWTTGSNLILVSSQYCALLNTWITLHDWTDADSRLLTASSAATLRVWWFGGGLQIVGNTPTAGRYAALCGEKSANVRLANLIIESRDKIPCLLTINNGGATEYATNSSTNISHIAAMGAQDATTGNPILGDAAGFDQAPGFIDLDDETGGRWIGTTERISEDSVLYRAGKARPFTDAGFGAAKYDANQMPRPGVPSIGAYDVLNASSSGGGSGGGMGYKLPYVLGQD